MAEQIQGVSALELPQSPAAAEVSSPVSPSQEVAGTSDPKLQWHASSEELDSKLQQSMKQTVVNVFQSNVVRKLRPRAPFNASEVDPKPAAAAVDVTADEGAPAIPAERKLSSTSQDTASQEGSISASSSAPASPSLSSLNTSATHKPKLPPIQLPPNSPVLAALGRSRSSTPERPSSPIITLPQSPLSSSQLPFDSIPAAIQNRLNSPSAASAMSPSNSSSSGRRQAPLRGGASSRAIKIIAQAQAAEGITQDLTGAAATSSTGSDSRRGTMMAIGNNAASAAAVAAALAAAASDSGEAERSQQQQQQQPGSSPDSVSNTPKQKHVRQISIGLPANLQIGVASPRFEVALSNPHSVINSPLHHNIKPTIESPASRRRFFGPNSGLRSGFHARESVEVHAASVAEAIAAGAPVEAIAAAAGGFSSAFAFAGASSRAKGALAAVIASEGGIGESKGTGSRPGSRPGSGVMANRRRTHRRTGSSMSIVSLVMDATETKTGGDSPNPIMSVQTIDAATAYPAAGPTPSSAAQSGDVNNSSASATNADAPAATNGGETGFADPLPIHHHLTAQSIPKALRTNLRASPQVRNALLRPSVISPESMPFVLPPSVAFALATAAPNIAAPTPAAAETPTPQPEPESQKPYQRPLRSLVHPTPTSTSFVPPASLVSQGFMSVVAPPKTNTLVERNAAHQFVPDAVAKAAQIDPPFVRFVSTESLASTDNKSPTSVAAAGKASQASAPGPWSLNVSPRVIPQTTIVHASNQLSPSQKSSDSAARAVQTEAAKRKAVAAEKQSAAKSKSPTRTAKPLSEKEAVKQLLTGVHAPSIVITTKGRVTIPKHTKEDKPSEKPEAIPTQETLSIPTLGVHSSSRYSLAPTAEDAKYVGMLSKDSIMDINAAVSAAVTHIEREAPPKSASVAEEKETDSKVVAAPQAEIWHSRSGFVRMTDGSLHATPSTRGAIAATATKLNEESNEFVDEAQPSVLIAVPTIAPTHNSFDPSSARAEVSAISVSLQQSTAAAERSLAGNSDGSTNPAWNGVKQYHAMQLPQHVVSEDSSTNSLEIVAAPLHASSSSLGSVMDRETLGVIGRGHTTANDASVQQVLMAYMPHTVPNSLSYSSDSISGSNASIASRQPHQDQSASSLLLAEKSSRGHLHGIDVVDLYNATATGSLGDLSVTGGSSSTLGGLGGATTGRSALGISMDADVTALRNLKKFSHMMGRGGSINPNVNHDSFNLRSPHAPSVNTSFSPSPISTFLPSTNSAMYYSVSGWETDRQPVKHMNVISKQEQKVKPPIVRQLEQDEKKNDPTSISARMLAEAAANRKRREQLSKRPPTGNTPISAQSGEITFYDDNRRVQVPRSISVTPLDGEADDEVNEEDLEFSLKHFGAGRGRVSRTNRTSRNISRMGNREDEMPHTPLVEPHVYSWQQPGAKPDTAEVKPARILPPAVQELYDLLPPEWKDDPRFDIYTDRSKENDVGPMWTYFTPTEKFDYLLRENGSSLQMVRKENVRKALAEIEEKRQEKEGFSGFDSLEEFLSARESLARGEIPPPPPRKITEISATHVRTPSVHTVAHSRTTSMFMDSSASSTVYSPTELSDSHYRATSSEYATRPVSEGLRLGPSEVAMGKRNSATQSQLTERTRTAAPGGFKRDESLSLLQPKGPARALVMVPNPGVSLDHASGKAVTFVHSSSRGTAAALVQTDHIRNALILRAEASLAKVQQQVESMELHDLVNRARRNQIEQRELVPYLNEGSQSARYPERNSIGPLSYTHSSRPGSAGTSSLPVSSVASPRNSGNALSIALGALPSSSYTPSLASSRLTASAAVDRARTGAADPWARDTRLRLGQSIVNGHDGSSSNSSVTSPVQKVRSFFPSTMTHASQQQNARSRANDGYNEVKKNHERDLNQVLRVMQQYYANSDPSGSVQPSPQHGSDQSVTKKNKPQVHVYSWNVAPGASPQPSPRPPNNKSSKNSSPPNMSLSTSHTASRTNLNIDLIPMPDVSPTVSESVEEDDLSSIPHLEPSTQRYLLQLTQHRESDISDFDTNYIQQIEDLHKTHMEERLATDLQVKLMEEEEILHQKVLKKREEMRLQQAALKKHLIDKSPGSPASLQ